MTKIKPEYGIFKNSIPYARFGEGDKILLLLSGGPGNEYLLGFNFNLILVRYHSFDTEKVLGYF